MTSAAVDYLQWRPLSEPLPLLLFRPPDSDQPLLELPDDELLLSGDELPPDFELPLMPLDEPELRPPDPVIPSDWPIFLPNSRLLP